MQNEHTNKLIRFYEGADGLKTGYTEEAGYCLTATAYRDNMRLVAVVFGEPDSSTRNAEITKMLDYGFNVYDLQSLLATDNSLGKIKIIKGKKREVDIVPIEDVNLLYKTGTDMKKVSYKIKINKNIAPIQKGEIIGKIKIIENNSVTRSIGITVKTNVAKASVMRLYGRYLLDIVKGL